MINGPLYPITQDSSCHGQHTMPRNPWSFPWPVPHSCVLHECVCVAVAESVGSSSCIKITWISVFEDGQPEFIIQMEFTLENLEIENYFVVLFMQPLFFLESSVNISGNFRLLLLLCNVLHRTKCKVIKIKIGYSNRCNFQASYGWCLICCFDATTVLYVSAMLYQYGVNHPYSRVLPTGHGMPCLTFLSHKVPH